jgi:hypothetical protein
MFVIVHNNSVILGPMRWNRFRFENEIQEECEYSATLPDRNDEMSAITVSDNIKILPILGTDNPEYNPKIQILNGPFWEFTDTHAIFSYQPEYMAFEGAREMHKEQVGAERWNKENAGVTVTIRGNEYKFSSDRETRAVLLNAVTNLDVINWKFNRDSWLEMTKEEAQSVLNAIHTHVQESFNWEHSKIQELNNCSTVHELDAVVIKEE